MGNRQEVSLVVPVCVSGERRETCATLDSAADVHVEGNQVTHRRVCALGKVTIGLVRYFVFVAVWMSVHLSALLVIVCRGLCVRECVVMETWLRNSPFCRYSSETVSARVSGGQRRRLLDLMEATSLTPQHKNDCASHVSPNKHHAHFSALFCFSKLDDKPPTLTSLLTCLICDTLIFITRF